MQTLKDLFNSSFAVILFFAGLAKIWSAFGSAKALAIEDPVIGLQFGHLMLYLGISELSVACFVFFSKKYALNAAIVAWLATGFFLYRVGLVWIGYHGPCACLGNLTDALHISPQIADTAMKIVLANLLFGSYASLFWLWRQRTKAVPALSQN
jgi:hypothetical protein